MGGPAQEAPGECRSSYDVCADIADKFGKKDAFTEGKTQEDWIKELYEAGAKADGNMPTWDEIKEQGVYKRPLEPAIGLVDFRTDPVKNPLSTPSGKIEIYSEQLAEIAATWELEEGDVINPIPVFTPGFQGCGSVTDEYPLYCTGFHHKSRTHSSFGFIPELEQVARQQLWINPADAESRGIASGDTVAVKSPAGEIRIEALVTPRIIPGTIGIPQGAWHKADMNGDRVDEGACVNTLTTYRPTPLAKGNGPAHSIIARGSPVLQRGEDHTTQLDFLPDRRCTGCRTCEMACKTKDLSATIAFRKVYDYEGGAWSDVGDGTFTSDAFAYHVSLGCQHCAMPAYMAKCPQGAIEKDTKTGLVHINQEKCTGVGACVETCPYNVPIVDKALGKGVKCDGCADRVAEGKSPICVEACPLRALEFGDIEELRAKHEGTVAGIAPMPSPDETTPSIAILPCPAAKEPGDTTGAIANEKEVTGVANRHPPLEGALQRRPFASSNEGPFPRTGLPRARRRPNGLRESTGLRGRIVFVFHRFRPKAALCHGASLRQYALHRVQNLRHSVQGLP